ncbi:MAG: hypothetical protein AAEI08_01680 [Gammaproteobacteria bacterium]
MFSGSSYRSDSPISGSRYGTFSHQGWYLLPPRHNEPVTEIIETFYDNDQLEFRRNYIDGEQEGLQGEFDENGQLIWTGTFRNGELISE